MTVTENRTKRPSLFLIVVGVIIVGLLVAIAAVAFTTVSKQNERESLAQVKAKQLPALLEAKEELPGAVDEYLAAFKEALGTDGTVEQAKKGSEAELKAFKKAEASARAAVATLKNSPGAGNEDVRDSVVQFEQSYVEFIDYMAGLVDSYPQYVSLFGDDDSPCQGIFVGSTKDLTERNDLLAKAADECQAATKKLAASKNTTLVEYAQALEKRVIQMKADSAVTAKAEAGLADFTAKKNDLEKQIKRAIASKASDKKLYALADEAEALTDQIAAQQDAFDFAGDRYLRTVKEMPTLLGDVFAKHVPEQVKYFDSVVPLRAEVLERVLADAAVR